MSVVQISSPFALKRERRPVIRRFPPLVGLIPCLSFNLKGKGISCHDLFEFSARQTPQLGRVRGEVISASNCRPLVSRFDASQDVKPARTLTSYRRLPGRFTAHSL